MEAARARHLYAARVFAVSFYTRAGGDLAAVHIKIAIHAHALTVPAAMADDARPLAVEQRERAALRNRDRRTRAVRPDRLAVQAEHRAVRRRP